MRLLDSQHIYQKAIHTQGRTAKLKMGGAKIEKNKFFLWKPYQSAWKSRRGGAKERHPHRFNCVHTFRLMKFTYSRVKF